MMTTTRFPFAIKLIQGEHWQPVKDDTIRIILGIRGQLQMVLNQQSYELLADDLVVVNPFDDCELTFTTEALVGILEIYRKDVESQLGIQWSPGFDCNTLDATQIHQGQIDPKFNQLRASLLALLGVYFDSNDENVFLIYEKFLAVISCLNQQFRQEKIHSEKRLNAHIQKIVDRVQRDYAQPLSLEQLAKESYLSYNYLSKKFKDETGESFREYLKAVRLRHAAEELRQTDTSVLKVALNNGFSGSKSFHKLFKDVYGMTPKQFRTQRMSEPVVPINRSFTVLGKDAAMKFFANYLVAKESDEIITKKEHQKIVPIQQNGQLLRLPKRMLNIGKGDNWLQAECRHDLTTALNELQFDYVRMKGFCYDAQSPDYLTLFSEFQSNDLLFELIVGQGKRPMILFEMPVHAHDFQAVEVWYQQQLRFVRHLCKKFRPAEMARWYFEWGLTADPLLSFQWFQRFSQDLKKWSLQPQLGIYCGSLAVKENVQRIETFLAQAVLAEEPLAFFNYKANPADGIVPADHETFSLPTYQSHMSARIQKLLKKYQLQGEIFLADWNTIVGEGETFSGTFFRSAKMIKEMFDLADQVTGLGFWLNSESYHSAEADREPHDNSLSLFLVLSLKRPVFWHWNYWIGCMVKCCIKTSSCVCARMRPSCKF